MDWEACVFYNLKMKLLGISFWVFAKEPCGRSIYINNRGDAKNETLQTIYTVLVYLVLTRKKLSSMFYLRE